MNHLGFFKRIGATPVGPTRQAWDGELADGTRVLVLWNDREIAPRKYRALDRKPRHRGAGPVNRLRSLESHMEHDVPLLAILASPMDATTELRSVKSVDTQLYRVTEVSRDSQSWYVTLRKTFPGIVIGAALLGGASTHADTTNCTQTCVAQDRNGNCIEWQSYCVATVPECRQVCSFLDPQRGCVAYETVCR